MIAYSIKDLRVFHQSCIQQAYMTGQSRFITNIPCMHDKSYFLIGRIVTEIIHPRLIPFFSTYFCIRDMYKPVTTVSLNSSIARIYRKIVFRTTVLYPVIVGIISLISGRSSNKQKMHTGMSGQLICAI